LPLACETFGPKTAKRLKGMINIVRIKIFLMIPPQLVFENTAEKIILR
jgi:hypothetical protein